MMLINSLLSHANDSRWEEFIAELERLNVRRAVIVSGSSGLTESYVKHIISAIHVFAHYRGFDILHSGFPSQHGACDISEEDDVSGSRK